MKLLLKISFLLFSTAFLFSSCNNDQTYADQLKAEKKLISDFMSRNNYTVVETEPATRPYPKNVFFKTSTGLYINITNVGDTASEAVAVNDEVSLRYIQYTLGTSPDTASYMNTTDSPYLRKFSYYDFTQTKQSCKGWHEAVSYMKYNNAQAKVIVYSKLGFSEDQSSVTPYGYDMRIIINK